MTILQTIGLISLGGAVGGAVGGAATAGGGLMYLVRRLAAVLEREDNLDHNEADLTERRHQLDAERRELYAWRRRLEDQNHQRATPSDLAPAVNVGRHSVEAAWGTPAQAVRDEETGLIDASRESFVLGDGWDAAREVAAGGAR